MFKKIIIINLIILIFCNFNLVVFADDKIDNVNAKETSKVIQTVSNGIDLPKINSRHAVVMQRNSKAILYGKNEKIKTKMASTTKIMTSLLIIENTNLSNIVEVSKKAASTGGSRLGLKAKDKISVRDLLYGLMLRSGNDAAIALAEYICGSVEEFAILMNQKAEELGLKNTHFETPHGLDSANHYTTAYELAILADYALGNKAFANIVNTKTYTILINGNNKQISNTNELLGNLNGVYGVKTGFTNGAGRCLVTSIKRDNLDIICVVLGADTKKIRTVDSVELIQYVFNTFKNVNISKKIEEEFENWKKINCQRINIEKGIKNSINIQIQEYTLKEYPIKINSREEITVQIQANLNLQAPVKENTQIGNVVVSYNNKTIQTIPIITNQAVEKKQIINYIYQIIQNYNKYLENALNYNSQSG